MDNQWNQNSSMARIKYFENEKIVVYIYGEMYEKHHVRHVLILKKDEDCQYGFDGNPIKGTLRLRKQEKEGRRKRACQPDFKTIFPKSYRGCKAMR